MNLKELVDEINSGKYNTVFLLVIILLLFHLYFKLSDKKDKNIEHMADDSINGQIADAVKKYYLSDEFVKNISAVSAQIQKDGLNISGQISALDNINVSNRTNEGGRLRILNGLKNGQAGQTSDWSIWNMTGQYGNKLAFWRYNGNGENAGPALELQDDGTVNIPTSFYHRKSNYLYYPEDAIIYQNVFDALGSVIVKSGNPPNWDESSYRNTLWNGRRLLRIAFGKTSFPTGAKITVPAGKNVIWLRVLSDRWNCWQVFTASGTDLGNFSTGYRGANAYSPDGATNYTFWFNHVWTPIPVPGPGDYIICVGNVSNDGGTDGWISGLAFSTNPWAHATNSAVAYHWAVNGGDSTFWGDSWHSWNNDVLTQIQPGKITTLFVPVVPSGKNKLLYFIEHNSGWNGLMHNAISIDDTPIERIRTTWDHILARHVNSKPYACFAATMVPENLARGKRFLRVRIDLTNCDRGIHVREIGTIDLY